MNVLEKILEEVKEIEKKFVVGHEVLFALGAIGIVTEIKEIICSHMNHNGDDTEMVGWIPVNERFPELEEIVLVTVHTSEWISDCSSKHVPDDQKVHHPEEYGTYIGYVNRHGEWRFWDETMGETYCEKEFGTDKGTVYDVVTAWKPLPEPYKGGE
nr:MAG: protein of unknown function DUF551 [Bacteriophage sp.]